MREVWKRNRTQGGGVGSYIYINPRSMETMHMRKASIAAFFHSTETALLSLHAQLPSASLLDQSQFIQVKDEEEENAWDWLANYTYSQYRHDHIYKYNMYLLYGQSMADIHSHGKWLFDKNLSWEVIDQKHAADICNISTLSVCKNTQCRRGSLDCT